MEASEGWHFVTVSWVSLMIAIPDNIAQGEACQGKFTAGEIYGSAGIFVSFSKAI